MQYELTLYELGMLLNKIIEKYETALMLKVKISGGWMTLKSDVEIDTLPKTEGLTASNNVIGLKLNNGRDNLKITGLKNLKFKVNLSAAKYKEINKKGLSIDMIKEKSDKSTLKIDDSIIFSIKASVEDVNELMYSN